MQFQCVISAQALRAALNSNLRARSHAYSRRYTHTLYVGAAARISSANEKKSVRECVSV